VTVSLELLRRNAAKASINFTPPIDEYIKATHCIGMGSVIKIALQFKQAIWKPDTGFILSDESIPTWWTQLPDKRPLLTGWAGGSRAEILSKESDEAILEKALISLAFIFEKPLEDIKSTVLQSHVFNWQKNEFALGGYCYSMPESIEARKLLNTPLLNTLFFAGEALYEGSSPGTVEAALQSGKDVAKRMR
jgi:monoamine oxidase